MLGLSIPLHVLVCMETTASRHRALPTVFSGSGYSLADYCSHAMSVCLCVLSNQPPASASHSCTEHPCSLKPVLALFSSPPAERTRSTLPTCSRFPDQLLKRPAGCGWGMWCSSTPIPIVAAQGELQHVLRQHVLRPTAQASSWLQVGEVVRLAPKARQTVLFSATMTDEVRQLASLSLRQPVRLAADEPSTAPVRLSQEVLRLKVRPAEDSAHVGSAGKVLCKVLPA